MRSIKHFWIPVLIVSCINNGLHAQQPIKTSQQLDKKQQSIVSISAFTAQGNMQGLQKALNTGLDAGLTINEIKEIIVQLYAYAGFPRSLNALGSFMSTLKERKSKGFSDQMGKEASPMPADQDRLQFGTQMQTKLVGQPVKGELYEFAPAIDQFLKEHLFGAIFGRDNLEWKTRELATISALASLGGVDNQLRAHFGVGIYNGLTEAELLDLVSIIQSDIGAQEGFKAKEILQSVLEGRQNPNEPEKTSGQNSNIVTKTLAITGSSKEVASDKNASYAYAIIFAKGDKITNNNFTGDAWHQPMINPDSLNHTGVGNVTFAPGARTKWHSHPGGQILLATGGVGYYQEKGGPKRLLRKGDVIKCPPNVPHWHGASIDTEFIQVAITDASKGGPFWLEPVTDKEYKN
ncbi:carboxymuconolactone decarboxylase family protein [Flavitalea sp.]|nr:carboxymuconolactone decarboxylase family protein [Flavitalea sp.]